MTAFRGGLFVSTLLFAMLYATLGRSEEYQMTSDEVYLAQYILFENGYDIGLPDGVAGPLTKRAINEWQTYQGYSSTGTLTKAQVDELVASSMPNNLIWGAVSISPDGYFGVKTQFKSGVAAYKAALKECQARSDSPEKCATSTMWTDGSFEGWLAAYWCEKDDNLFVAIGNGFSMRESMKLAYLGVMKAKLFDPWDCHLPIAVSVTESYEVPGAVSERSETVH